MKTFLPAVWQPNKFFTIIEPVCQIGKAEGAKPFKKGKTPIESPFIVEEEWNLTLVNFHRVSLDFDTMEDTELKWNNKRKGDGDVV